MLTPEQQREMRELILEWRKKNPEKNAVQFIRFSDFGELGRKPTLEKVIEPGGLLAPVKEAAQEAEEIRKLIERAVFQFSRQLLIMNSQVELLFLELANKPESQQLISNIDAFKETSERYADLIEHMPKQIADQTDRTVDELMKAVAVERETAINQALEGIAKQLDGTIKQALDGVEQQREAVLKQLMEGVTLERKATVEQVLEGVTQMGKGSLIYISFFCAALIVIFFLAMFFYRYASSKIISTKNSRT